MNKKRLAGLFVLLLLLFSFSGCEKERDGKSNKEKEIVSGYTAREVYDAVAGAIKDMPEMDSVTSEDENAKDIFMVFSEMDYDKVEDFVISYSNVGLADELLVIRTKSNEYTDELKEDLEERLNNRKGTFEEYNPEEQSKFKGACVLVQDNYVVLIIGNQAQNGKYEFNKLF